MEGEGRMRESTREDKREGERKKCETERERVIERERDKERERETEYICLFLLPCQRYNIKLCRRRRFN